jgi:hypothetical protein
MAYSVNTLVDNLETVSETIGALLERSWTEDNTHNIVPKFLYDEDKPHIFKQSSLSDYIKIEEGIEAGFSLTDNALDNSQGQFEEDIIITVNTTSQLTGRLFENEIVNILRANFKTTLKKSDTTNNSGILSWTWPLPKFTRFGVGDEGQRKSFKSQLLLTIKSYYEWSD